MNMNVFLNRKWLMAGSILFLSVACQSKSDSTYQQSPSESYQDDSCEEKNCPCPDECAKEECEECPEECPTKECQSDCPCPEKEECPCPSEDCSSCDTGCCSNESEASQKQKSESSRSKSAQSESQKEPRSKTTSAVKPSSSVKLGS